MGLTGAFGVTGENYIERRVVDFCAEMRLYVINTYFEQNILDKYTRVARSRQREGKKH